MSEPLTEGHKQIAIAHYLGWKIDAELEDGALMGCPPGQEKGWDMVPDYFNDLNACAEMEKAMSPLERSAYIRDLWGVCHQGGSAEHYCEAIFATAAQRAEAFGEIKQLW